jgi:hypothetical protein
MVASRGPLNNQRFSSRLATFVLVRLRRFGAGSGAGSPYIPDRRRACRRLVVVGINLLEDLRREPSEAADLVGVDAGNRYRGNAGVAGSVRHRVGAECGSDRADRLARSSRACTHNIASEAATCSTFASIHLAD